MDSTRATRRVLPGKVRIIAGAYRGRRLAVPPVADLRPTPDRVRETLFNWLGQHLHGLACLDLFAGTGALGFEAASRGASRVVMVESNALAAKHLRAARAMLGAMQVEVVSDDAFRYLRGAMERFDVVFLDPPFRQNAAAALLQQLPGRLAPRARVYVESARGVPVQGPWRELRSARAGQVSYQLLQWEPDDQGDIPGDV